MCVVQLKSGGLLKASSLKGISEKSKFSLEYAGKPAALSQRMQGAAIGAAQPKSL